MNLLVLALEALVPATAASKADGASAAQPEDAAPDGSLVLVRSWDADTGELIGWMPVNHLVIVLQRVGQESPKLDLNEAITVHFPYRPLALVQRGEVRVTSKVVTQHGTRWLPLDANVNLVRLGKYFFYVKSIIFGESKWRRATLASPPTAQPVLDRDANQPSANRE